MAQGLSEDEEFELLSLERERALASQPPSNQKPSILDRAWQTVGGMVQKIANDPLTQMGLQVAGGDVGGAMLGAKGIAQNPSAAVRSPSVQAGLPIAGGIVGGVPGAMTGETLRQMAGQQFAPETIPKTPLGKIGMIAGAGVAQDPKILEAIPGVSRVGKMAGNLAAKTGKGIANTFQALSGGKAGDFIETAKKGLSMYAAPSKPEAGQMMASALEKLPGESLAPTLKETVQSAITPEASTANKFLIDLADKMDKGHLPDAREALKAKQSLDDVIDTVPIWQAKRRGALFDIKKTFDDVLSSQSGELKDASNAYRAAALKDNMTKFLPVNKHGEYSRLAPMLTTLASSVGGGMGGHYAGTKGGVMGALGPPLAMVALSPGSLGGLSATGGGLMQLGENPAVRQALLQVLQRIRQNSSAGAPQ